jgi:hypothetical protein
MVGPLERRLLDEEVVDEQLAADVDGNDGGRRLQVRRELEVLREIRRLRRPRRGQPDAVVKRLAGRRVLGQQREDD